MSSDPLENIPLPSEEFCAAAPPLPLINDDSPQEACAKCIEVLSSGVYVAEHAHPDFGIQAGDTFSGESDKEKAAKVCVLDSKQNMIDAKEKETPPSE